MQELIERFMSKKKFAVIGATANPHKFGNKIVKNLKNRGYDVYPVNPGLKELEGLKCYPSLQEIPTKVDVVDFVVPPEVTEEVIKECRALGLNNIWLQPGAESDAAIDYCRKHGLNVVHDVCVMQH